jgi:hypothetical protein
LLNLIKIGILKDDFYRKTVSVHESFETGSRQ